jgi:hypothetical protein
MDGVEYYDISEKTAPLIISDSPAWTGTTPEMRRRARSSLYAMRGTVYDNADTGWKITIGRDAIDKTLSESGRPEHFQALEKLPELLRNAIPVRRKIDTKKRGNASAYYRLYAPITINGHAFAAQITIKEGEGEKKHFYVQRLQIKEPAVTRGAGAARAQTAALQQAGSLVSIPGLLRDVKSEDAPKESP